jgi:Cu-Zn family superoxide dismutase
MRDKAALAATLGLLAAACAETAAPPPAAAPAPAPAGMGEADALAELESPGKRNGLATFDASPHGVLIGIHFGSLPPGVHGMHLHAKGDCSDAGFQSAGPHVHTGAPGAHGLLNPKGPEAGDLPNLIVGEDGRAQVQLFTSLIRLPALLDADGAAIVVHAGPDDHVSQPIGGSGARIACGVIKPNN